MTDHNIVRMVHAIEERISGGSATDTNSAGRVQASVDGTFLADVISVKPLSIQLQGQTVSAGIYINPALTVAASDSGDEILKRFFHETFQILHSMDSFFKNMNLHIIQCDAKVQMDMKIQGLTPEIIKGAIENTHKARTYILDEVMLKAIAEPRKQLSEYAPKIEFVQINPDKMAEVIGSKGKVINRILEESGVDKIDTEDGGKIYVSSPNADAIAKAVSMIKCIAEDPEVGQIYTGTVTRIMQFGAFVEIAPEKEGLVHISKLAKERVAKVEDIVKEGDVVKVKVIEIDDKGRINLSIKDCLE